jgi:hypothetical protein
MAGVLISEFMAINSNTLPDLDGDYSDWIEIHNSGTTDVNLAGYHLTDKTDDLTRWTFPDVNLPPGGYLVVFASNKNRLSGELHTDFALDGDGEYLALVAPDNTTILSEYDFPEQIADVSYGVRVEAIETALVSKSSTVRANIPGGSSLGTTWTQIDFDDGAWSSGTPGVGYETEVAPPAIPGFTVRMVDTGGGNDANISDIGEASRLIDGTSPAGAFTIAYDGTQDYSDIDFNAGGNFGFNRMLPIGVSPTDDSHPGRTQYALRATANVVIPAGTWSIAVGSDDGFQLTIPGVTFTRRVNENLAGTTQTPDSLAYGAPRGHGVTFGTFTVPAGGLSTTLRLDFYEAGGGDTVELSIASGDRTTFSPGGNNFNLLDDLRLGWRVTTTSSTPPPNFNEDIELDVRPAMYGVNSSAYIRAPFFVENPADFDTVKFRMKYDAGYVAYLNGVKIAERNAPVSPAWNSFATAERNDSDALVFEEIFIPAGSLQTGPNVLAIQGLNLAAADDDFLISPELIGRTTVQEVVRYFTQPTPGQPNAPSDLTGVVSDTNFDFDRGFYESPFNLTITTATPGATIRYTTNGDAPTATTGSVYTGPIAIGSTTVVRAAAFKPGMFPSNVDSQTYLFLEDVIRQSPNGETPPGWPSSWGSNVVDYGMDPDIVNNPAYSGIIKDALTSIPTMSIVMNLDDLFDPSTGIYANPYGDGQSWERPTSLELIYPDATEGFQVDAGIRIRGGFSRSTDNPKHAFRFFFRSEYGDSMLRYPLFGPDAAQEFDGFDLRTFQNYSWSFQGDSRGIFVRDQFNRDVQLAMGQDGERGDYYHLYINGVYWGLFNTCERPEASHGATYFGGNDDDYDVIKVSPDDGYIVYATDGNMNAWSELWNGVLADVSGTAAGMANYLRLQGKNPDGSRNLNYSVLLDVDNLIDYMLVIFYGGNLDAPLSNFLGNTSPNNFFAARNRNGDQGFKFYVHDAEHTLLSSGENRTGPYTISTASLSKSNPQWMFQRLVTNPEFQLRVADRIQKHFFNDGVLTPAKAGQLFDQRTSEIFQAVVAESARWGDSKQSTPLTRVHWQNEVNRVRNNYIPGRTNTVFSQLVQDNLYPTLGAPLFSRFGGPIDPGFQLTLSKPVGSPAGATIYYTLDGSDPRLVGGGLSGSAVAYTGPITLNASTQVTARIRNGSTWSALVEADFIAPSSPIPGDYDGSGLVDDGDYTFWRSGFSSTVAPSSGADGSGSGVIDAADYVIWRRQMGNGSASVASGAAAISNEPASELGSPLSTPEPAVQSVARSAAFAETFDSPHSNDRPNSRPRIRSAWRLIGDVSSENLLGLLASHRVRDDDDAAGNSRRPGQVELAIDQPSDRVSSSFDDALDDWHFEIRERFSI